jgi:nucleotide-binding universal stress UspA family protein
MKFLLPVDGSELSLQAVQHVIGLYHAGLPVEVVLVNVQEPASAYEMLTLHDPEALAEVTVAAGRDLMQAAVNLLQTAKLPFFETVVVGDVVPALLEVLEEEGCEAVVMGSHGYGVVRSVLGSVSHGLLEDSPVPVTFVKAVSEPEPDADVDSE